MDDQGFAELVEPHRRELRLHCYRMLGSFTDAEDMLQETLLAAWRGLPGFEGRSSARAWLYRIATNRCLNARRDAARRVPAEPVPPFEVPEPTRRGEITWLQPYPDALLDPAAGYELKESVHLAFVAGLQRMPPRQTAVLLLRDVLGFSADEVAAMLGTTTTAVKGSLQRARAALDRPPMPDAAAEPALVRRFADAFTRRDVDALVALLTDDAWLAMPPAPHEYHGRAAVAAFLAASFAWSPELRLVPAGANRQPGFACYTDGPAGLVVLTLRGDRIAGLTRFHDNAALLSAGLLEDVDQGG